MPQTQTRPLHPSIGATCARSAVTFTPHISGMRPGERVHTSPACAAPAAAGPAAMQESRPRALPASLRGAPISSGEATPSTTAPLSSAGNDATKTEGQVAARQRTLPASLLPSASTGVSESRSLEQVPCQAEVCTPATAAAPKGAPGGHAAAPGSSPAAGVPEQSCEQHKPVKPNVFSMMMSASRTQAPGSSSRTPEKGASRTTAAHKSGAADSSGAAENKRTTGVSPSLQVLSMQSSWNDVREGAPFTRTWFFAGAGETVKSVFGWGPGASSAWTDIFCPYVRDPEKYAQKHAADYVRAYACPASRYLLKSPGR